MNQPDVACRFQHEAFLPHSLSQTLIPQTPLSPPTDDTSTYEPEQILVDENGSENGTSSSDHDAISNYIKGFPGAAKISEHGMTFMDLFDSDTNAHFRQDIPYYPFTSREEWEIASFLLRSDLSMNAIDEFLKLAMVRPLILLYYEFLFSFILDPKSVIIL